MLDLRNKTRPQVISAPGQPVMNPYNPSVPNDGRPVTNPSPTGYGGVAQTRANTNQFLANAAENMGMDRANTYFQNKGDKFQNRADLKGEHGLVLPRVKEGIQTGIETGKGLLGKGQEAWEEKMTPGAAVRDNADLGIYRDAVDNFNPQQGRLDFEAFDQFGDSGKYGRAEAGAMDALGGRMGDSGRDRALTDFEKTMEAVSGNKSDFEKDYAGTMSDAMQGKLTAADSELLKEQNRIMDLSAEDSRREMLEKAGASRGIGGGRFAKEQGRFEEGLSAQKAAMAAQFQKDAADRAGTYMGQAMGRDVDLTRIGAGMASDIGNKDISAAGQQIGAVGQAGQRIEGQENLKLKQEQDLRNAEIAKIGMQGNVFKDAAGVDSTYRGQNMDFLLGGVDAANSTLNSAANRRQNRKAGRGTPMADIAGQTAGYFLG